MGTQAQTALEDDATVSPSRIVLQCRYCLRVHDGRGWMQFSAFLRDYNLSASEVFLAETYCEPCAAASRQVVTYGPAAFQGRH
jgi:hypothetical protein